MQKNHTGKILAIGIIALFIGVGIHPAFAVDTKISNVLITDNKDCNLPEEDLVEVIVTVYGIDWTDNYKIFLTQEEAKILDHVINELDLKLKNTTSKVESLTIFKRTIDKLIDLNLYKKYDVNDILSLTISDFSNFQLEYNNLFSFNNYKENFNCLIKSDMRFGSGLWFQDGEGPLLKFLLDMLYKLGHSFLILALIGFLITIYRQFRGWENGGTVILGEIDHTFGYYGKPEIYKTPAEGDIWTIGENWIVKWTGKFWGQIRVIYSEWESYYGLERRWDYVGIEGFTGTKIYNLKTGRLTFIGFAQHVALGSNIPE